MSTTFIEGGAVRVNNINWFEGIMNMIQKSIKIECISYQSLKGFIFVIEVNPEDAQFKCITKGGVNKKLNKILLKFVSIGKEETKIKDKFIYKDENGNDNKSYPKYTDSETDFINEAKKQNELFKNTYKKGKMAICPSVLLLEILKDGNGKSYFFDILEKKLTADTLEKKVFEYIKEEKSYDLGIIAMEYAEDFITFYKFKINTVDETKKNFFNKIKQKLNGSEEEEIKKWHRVALILSNLIILFIHHKFVHCDLHGNNIMVKDVNKDECNNYFKLLSFKPISCLRMIDFGRFKEIKEDDTKIEDYNNTIKKKYNDMISYIGNKNISSDILNPVQCGCFVKSSNYYETILEILKKIWDEDVEYNKRFNSTIPQAIGIFSLARFNKESLNEFQKYILDLIIQYLQTYEGLPEENIEGLFSKIYDVDKEQQNKDNENNVENKTLGTFLKYFLKELKEKNPQISGTLTGNVVTLTPIETNQTEKNKEIEEKINKIVKELGGNIEFKI